MAIGCLLIHSGIQDTWMDISEEMSQKIIDMVNSLTERAIEPLNMVTFPNAKSGLLYGTCIVWGEPNAILAIQTSGQTVSVFRKIDELPEYFFDTGNWDLHKLLYEALDPLFKDLNEARKNFKAP